MKTLAGWPPELTNDESQKSFWLSVAIAKYFLGQDWIDAHVRPGDATGFLRQYEDRVDDHVKMEEQSFRVVDFAELLFNLQHTAGFDDCLERVRQGLIEPTYAELDLGRMLYLSEIDFRFVIPRGTLGDDYDIEITLSDWPTVCADAKCKLETTEFTRETVRNTLNAARKQFPPNLPSIVFVKVPPQWRKEPFEVGKILFDVATEFLRSTGRVVSVKYYTSRISWHNGAVTHVQAFKELSNPRNRFDPNRNWDMFTESDERAEPNAGGEFTDVPRRWRRLIYFPHGVFRYTE